MAEPAAPAAPGQDPARFAAQLLSGPPARTVGAVVQRLLAVQAQDPRGARLAVRARSRGRTAAEIDAAVTAERSLLVTWLNRGTLHLVVASDYWWLHPLTTPQLRTGSARRLAQEGVSPGQADRGVELIRRAVERDGPRTRRQLRELLAAAGIPVAGQALVHLLMASALRGDTVRGPMVGAEQAYVLVADWLGPAPPALSTEVGLGRLARRYLAGHGPAAAQDLAKWAGIPLRAARRGLAGIAGELDCDASGRAALRGRPVRARIPAPRLLGAFDPLLHGWVDRRPVLGDAQGIITRNGIFYPFVLVSGRAVGTWRLAGGQVVLELFTELSPQDSAALDAEAADVVRFLGG